jgi:hypothetical protein
MSRVDGEAYIIHHTPSLTFHIFSPPPEAGFLPCLTGRQGYLLTKVSIFVVTLNSVRSSQTKRSCLHPESAPLLQDNGGPQAAAATPSITDRLGLLLQDPLTPLNKILLVLLLTFLLLCSIFIGLFIGSQHKLNNVPDSPGGGKPPSTYTSIVTVPSFTTATVIVTTTLPGVPPPGPTIPPERVCLYPIHPLLISFDKLPERMLLPPMRRPFRDYSLFLGHCTGPL